jgi:hypothetical protein
LLVFDSDALKYKMSSFWKTLASLRNKWEEQAGAEWAWEVQKKVKTRGRARGGSGASRIKRFCVSSRLADRPTKWRRGDSGFFACLGCARAAEPCFTWVGDEDGGVEGDDDEVFGAPKGEFWCLPVHKDDRRCVDVKGKEMRSWVNEGESSSGEDDSGEESDESGFDAYDDGDSELTSEASSEESSEEAVDSDGEL